MVQELSILMMEAEHLMVEGIELQLGNQVPRHQLMVSQMALQQDLKRQAMPETIHGDQKLLHINHNNIPTAIVAGVSNHLLMQAGALILMMLPLLGHTCQLLPLRR